jgi:TP901 family phage tail tape measure protein
MTTLANLRVNFTANTADFDKGASRMQSGLGKVASGLAALGGGAALGQIMSNAIEAGSAIHDLGQRSNLTAEMLSGVKMGVEQAGSSLEVFNKAAIRLNKSTDAAMGGSKKMASAFAELGISVEAFSKLSADDKIRTFAEALSKVNDEGQQQAIVQRVMGQQGVQLMEIWRGGAKGLDDLAAASSRANQSMTTEQANAADAAGDAIDTLKKSWAGLQMQLGLGLAPKVTQQMESMTRGLLVIADTVSKVFSVINGTGNFIGGFLAASGAAVSGNLAGARAIWGQGAFGGEMAAGPSGAAPVVSEQKRTNQLLAEQTRLNKEMIGAIKQGRVVAQ